MILESQGLVLNFHNFLSSLVLLCCKPLSYEKMNTFMVNNYEYFYALVVVVRDGGRTFQIL